MSSGCNWRPRASPTTSPIRRPVSSLRLSESHSSLWRLMNAEAVVAVDVRHARRHVVHDEPQLRLARAQRFLRLLQPMDVVHQHERAGDLALRAHVRNDADGHPPAHAVGARDEAVERRRFAAQRAREHHLRALIDAVTDDVAQAQLRHLLRREPEVVQEGSVDVLAALVAVDVGHRRRHAVHDRAQLRFARGQGILRLLEVGDVVADDVVALDRAVEAEVGNDAVAQPALAAVGVDALALVGDATRLWPRARCTAAGIRLRRVRARPRRSCRSRRRDRAPPGAGTRR